MTQNIYTTQFATKAEVNSEISQTAQSIDLSVNQKLTNYSTTSQMNSAINMKANEITSIVNDTLSDYSTTTQMNSAINQKANEITSSVNSTLSNYSTTTQMNSAINQKANQITSTVSATYETKSNASNTYATKTQLNTAKSEIKQTTDSISTTVSKKVGNDEIISKINQSSEAVTINANKVSLNGKTINLTSDNIAIQSTNFSVDKNGNMICNNANINGTITSNNATITGGKINVSGSGSATDLVRVSTDGNSSIFSYIQPRGAGFIYGSSNNAVYIWAGDTSDVEVSDNYGTSTISGGYIRTPQIIQTSKEEQKKNIEKYTNNALEIIKNIDIYKYNLKLEDNKTKKHIGFVIGDEYKYSEEVTSNENNGVDLYSFVSLCCKAIQEQQAEIEELKKRLEEQSND